MQDELRREIIAGRFQPGERLFEDQLAQELDVSRNPVREALQALAAEGFVELEPRRGARVADVSRRRAEELFEVREALEGLVARLAARRRTAEQLARLEALTASGLAAVAEGDIDRLPQLNTAFHEALTIAAANELLAGQLDRLSHLVQWVYSARIKLRSGDSWVEHAAIVAAIAANDEELAFRCASEHIAAARAAFLTSA